MLPGVSRKFLDLVQVIPRSRKYNFFEIFDGPLFSEILELFFLDLFLDLGKIKRVSKADSYGNEELIRKWIKSVFCFCFFSILWEREWSRLV